MKSIKDKLKVALQKGVRNVTMAKANKTVWCILWIRRRGACLEQ